MFLILDTKQIENLKKCGHILAEVMNQALKAVKVGVTTAEIDKIVEDELERRGAKPSFKGYNVGGDIYPNSICISINAELVHGLPSSQVVLKEGNIVSIDIGAFYSGIHTDMARTVGLGKISPEAKKLIKVTQKALKVGISQARGGYNIGAIGQAIEKYVKGSGLNVIKDLVGHGIGTSLHMEPQIPNYGDGSLGPAIKNGMALAIEPMVTNGNPKLETEENGWTISTKDNSLCAHFEDTVVIVEGKPVIVTR
jgi:methionyl aminopeptidase